MEYKYWLQKYIYLCIFWVLGHKDGMDAGTADTAAAEAFTVGYSWMKSGTFGFVFED